MEIFFFLKKGINFFFLTTCSVRACKEIDILCTFITWQRTEDLCILFVNSSHVKRK